MIAINLINWRAQKKIILNRRFAFVMGVVVLITVLLCLIVYSIINTQISAAEDGGVYLDTQLKEVSGTLDKIKTIKQKKESLQARRKTIDTLQASRPLDVEMFDNIARIMPPGVVLSQIVRKDNMLTISGDSDSNYNVSVLMENAQKLPWVKLAKLGQLKTVEAEGAGRNAQNSGKVSFEINLTLDAQKTGVDNAPKGN